MKRLLNWRERHQICYTTIEFPDVNDKMEERISPSVRRAIVELRVYVTQLERERVELNEDITYHRNVAALRKKERLRKRPFCRKILRPMFEISEQMNLNITEVEQIQRRNAKLKEEIAEVERKLAIPNPMIELEEKTNYAIHLLYDYQQVFNDFTRAPEVPFPQCKEYEENWAIGTGKGVELPKAWRELCGRMAALPRDFNGLPKNVKLEVMHMLKELKRHVSESIRELKTIEWNVGDLGQREVLTRMCLKRIAAMSLSMQRMRFEPF